jgi:hypothetical protein
MKSTQTPLMESMASAPAVLYLAIDLVAACRTLVVIALITNDWHSFDQRESLNTYAVRHLRIGSSR